MKVINYKDIDNYTCSDWRYRFHPYLGLEIIFHIPEDKELLYTCIPYDALVITKEGTRLRYKLK